MGWTILVPQGQTFVHPRATPDETGRTVLRLRDHAPVGHSQASVWRYPPGGKGRRHRHLTQEEIFFVHRGTLTVLVGDDAVREVLPEGSIVFLAPRTPVYLANEEDEELVLFIYGAPADGEAEYLPLPDDA